MESDNTEFLTVAEVAELLKLNQQTVRNWIDAGTLPALKVGRRVRIRRADLEAKLEAGRTTAAPAARGSGPSADDFWSGATVGVAEVAPSADLPGSVEDQ
jgi:excisionase family DNA binding protein